MYHIGIAGGAKTEQEVSVWKEEGPKEWRIEDIEIKGQHQLFDLVVILDEGEEAMGTICEKIIRIKDRSEALIWVKTNEQNVSNRLVYLTLGADGVTHAESNQEEWFLMMNNALKRRKREQIERTVEKAPHQKENECSKNLVLNPRNSSVLVAGHTEIVLTRLEFKTLSLLIQHPNEAVTYEEIFNELWTGDQKSLQYRVSNVIFHIRGKIDPVHEGPTFIKTVRSVGYLYVE